MDLPVQKATSNSSVGNVNDFIKLQISFNQAMLKKSKGNSVQIKLLQNALIKGGRKIEWLQMQIQQQSRGLKIIRAVILYMKQQRGYDKQKILDLEMAVNNYQTESKAMMDRIEQNIRDHSVLLDKNKEMVEKLMKNKIRWDFILDLMIAFLSFWMNRKLMNRALIPSPTARKLLQASFTIAAFSVIRWKLMDLNVHNRFLISN